MNNNKHIENGSRNNGERFRPTESARVNETTITDLFITERGPLWGLSRVNEQGGRSYRTMKPEQLGDAAEAIAFLCGVFAKDTNCPLELKNYLSALGKELQSVVDRAKAGFPARENGESPLMGLLSGNAA
ncbi:hypothetical protein [Bythopirellula goksoeyrii]|nr:hypothetical protein [Bythopirellula goksoeyrii]